MFSNLSKEVGELLLKNGLELTTVESCTGGGLASAITDISGASAYFGVGYVTYANSAKIALGVKKETLEKHGAVSLEVAGEMALSAIQGAKNKIAISITGIAGPTGGTPLKPVGTVCFGLSYDGNVQVEKKHFNGERKDVKAQSILYALERLKTFLENKKP